nr:immunoglobulin heavy chain junction region [Macaca mulatta]
CAKRGWNIYGLESW